MATRVERKEAARAQREAAERKAARGERVRATALSVLAGLLAAGALASLSLASAHRNAPPAVRADRPAAGATAVNALLAGIPEQGTTLGRTGAPLTLVEYADLQCPFCGEAARNVLPTLIQRYVRTGRLKIEFRPLAFVGPDSVRLAKVAAATAAQNRLWPFVELAYRNQGTENSGYATGTFVRGVAGSVPGLDVAAAVRAASGSTAAALVARAQTQASADGVSSTPSFRLVDRAGHSTALESKSLDVQAFTPAIDRALAVAGAA